jgi:pyridoxal phosphate enzyme (YggS family)
MFHGVDSLETAEQMNRIAAETGVFPKVLLEVNVAGEATKFGFPMEGLPAQMDRLLSLPRLEILGLMAIPPPAEEPEGSRRYFRALAALRGQLESRGGVRLPELSMGMSGDFEVAIEEGATWVRIGSALFGDRPARAWRPAEGDFLDV